MDEFTLFEEALTSGEAVQLMDSCSSGFVSVDPGRGWPAAVLARPRLHPNPAVGSTSIEFTIPAPGMVDLSVFDLAGRQVKQLSHRLTASTTNRTFWQLDDDEGRKVPPGVYLVAVRWNGLSASRSVTVVK